MLACVRHGALTVLQCIIQRARRAGLYARQNVEMRMFSSSLRLAVYVRTAQYEAKLGLAILVYGAVICSVKREERNGIIEGGTLIRDAASLGKPILSEAISFAFFFLNVVWPNT